MGRLEWWLPNGTARVVLPNGYGSCEVLPNGTAHVVVLPNGTAGVVLNR